MKANRIQVFLVAILETENSSFYEKYEHDEIRTHNLVIWSRVIYHQTTLPYITMVFFFFLNYNIAVTVGWKILPLFRPKFLIVIFRKSPFPLDISKSTRSTAVKFTGHQYFITKHLLVKFDSYTLRRFRDIEREMWFSKNHNRAFRSERRQYYRRIGLEKNRP